MDRYIEKFGKELMTEILDTIIIGKQPNKELVKKLMIKQGIITKSTSDIRIITKKLEEKYYYVSFNVYNMANHHKLYFSTHKNNLPSLVKEFKELTTA